MDFTASVRFDNFSVGAVKAGVLLQDYRNGNIQLEEGYEPYRDTQANRKHSTVASGGRTLATILHYLGGMPNIDRATQYTPLSGEIWGPSWDTEVVVSLVYGKYSGTEY